jgi:hypothetical protein
MRSIFASRLPFFSRHVGLRERAWVVAEIRVHSRREESRKEFSARLSRGGAPSKPPTLGETIPMPRCLLSTIFVLSFTPAFAAALIAVPDASPSVVVPQRPCAMRSAGIQECRPSLLCAIDPACSSAFGSLPKRSASSSSNDATWRKALHLTFGRTAVPRTQCP